MVTGWHPDGRLIYTTNHYATKPNLQLVALELDEHTYERIPLAEASEGRWRLVPVDEGSSTLVRYEAVMSSGRAVPAFVQDILMRRSLRKLLASLRTETERRHARIGDPE